MSDPTPTTTELTVTIHTEGALLTLTPRSLLEYYLPHAEEVRPGVWKGKSSTGKDVYLQTEVLAGALLDCKEKQLNPVTEIYLLPSTTADRKASHKVKYTVGLERMRELPGFLGINSGLVVERDKDIQRRNGRMCYPGDTVLGAWAKAYFVGMPEPLEHEVDLASCEVEHSLVWKERPGFMLLKVVEDELWRLKVLPRMKPQDREAIDGEAILLEAQPPAAPTPTPPSTRGRATTKAKPAAPAADTRPRYEPGTLYPGTVATLTAPSGLDAHGRRTPTSRPGTVTLAGPDGDPLTCLFWTTPDILMPTASWPDLIGKHAVMSFREKPNDRGTVFRFIDTVDIVTDATDAIPADDAPAQPAPATKEYAA